MYLVFVPVAGNNGVEFPVTFHEKWDAEVCKTTGGMTIFRSAVGKWVNDGSTQVEKMIPVMIGCDDTEIRGIIEFTKSFYRQIAIAYVRMGNIHVE